MKMIVAELQSPESDSTKNVWHLVNVLLSIVNRNKETDKNYTYSKKLEKILPALNLITKKYKEHIQIETLANACHFNVGYFRRIFKELTNCTPIDYIHRVRLEEATLLLSQTTMSVLEISETVGFQSLSNFNRSFLSSFGVSPTKYRQQQLSTQSFT